ncbi:hypothetical protein BH11BAC3_BH11BAC3_00940 [soil metagenome]
MSESILAMNKEQIRNVTDGYYNKMNKNIKKIEADFDVEAIHQFRVTYKKVRAFLRMLSSHHETAGEIKVSGHLKKCYALLGAIRDLQIHQQQISEVTKKVRKKPTAYLKAIQNEIEKLQPELAEVLNCKPVVASRLKTNASIPHKFALNSLGDFIEKKWIAIDAIISSEHFSDDNIHSIRKHLKDMFYNLNVFHDSEHDLLAQSFWKNKDENYFELLLTELGNFQDKCTSIAFMKTYLVNSLTPNDKQLLYSIKTNWLKEKAAIKQRLVRKLKKDIGLVIPAYK